MRPGCASWLHPGLIVPFNQPLLMSRNLGARRPPARYPETPPITASSTIWFPSNTRSFSSKPRSIAPLTTPPAAPHAAIANPAVAPTQAPVIAPPAAPPPTAPRAPRKSRLSWFSIAYQIPPATPPTIPPTLGRRRSGRTGPWDLWHWWGCWRRIRTVDRSARGLDRQ